MEYNDKNEKLPKATVQMLLQQIILRQNDQAQQIADLRAALALATTRMDEADHMTSEEYGAQVVQQVMNAMPAIQAAAMKSVKRGRGK